MLHVLAPQLRQRRRRLLLPLLVLQLLCLGQIAALSLPNGTMLSGDGNAAGNVNLPTLGGAGLGIVNGSLGSGGVNSGSASLPGGGGGSGGSSGSQSNQELNAGGNTLGAGAGGSGAGGGAGAAGSSNNSALLQAPKEKQYERCTGPGDPGPCKQYIYKWRYEPSTSECTTFIWGGCDGNPHNRFSTEAECLYHCIGGPRKRIIVVSQESISYQKCAFPFPSSLFPLCRHFTAIFAVDHTRAKHHRILTGQLHAKSGTTAGWLWWRRRRRWWWRVWRRWLWQWHHAGAHRATWTRVNICRNGSGQDLRVRQKQHVHPNGRRHHTDISITVSGRGRERVRERKRERGRLLWGLGQCAWHTYLNFIVRHF